MYNYMLLDRGFVRLMLPINSDELNLTSCSLCFWSPLFHQYKHFSVITGHPNMAITISHKEVLRQQLRSEFNDSVYISREDVCLMPSLYVRCSAETVLKKHHYIVTDVQLGQV